MFNIGLVLLDFMFRFCLSKLLFRLFSHSFQFLAKESVLNPVLVILFHPLILLSSSDLIGFALLSLLQLFFLERISWGNHQKSYFQIDLIQPQMLPHHLVSDIAQSKQSSCFFPTLLNLISRFAHSSDLSSEVRAHLLLHAVVVVQHFIQELFVDFGGHSTGGFRDGCDDFAARISV